MKLLFQTQSRCPSAHRLNPSQPLNVCYYLPRRRPRRTEPALGTIKMFIGEIDPIHMVSNAFPLSALSITGRLGLPPAQFAPYTAASAKSGTYA